jgi:hypothetical protein
MAHRRTLSAAGGIGLELIATAVAALGAPTIVWVFVMVLGVGMLAYAALLYLAGREQPVTESGKGDHIEQHIGGDVRDSTIIGKKVDIHAPPQAQARGELVASQQKEGDTYLTRMILNIAASYAAQRLRIDAHGTSISDFNFYEPPREMGPGVIISGGLEQMVMGDTGPTHAWKQVDKPASSYWVDVRTKQPETPRIEVRLV